jgi:hypothetical protein
VLYDASPTTGLAKLTSGSQAVGTAIPGTDYIPPFSGTFGQIPYYCTGILCADTVLATDGNGNVTVASVTSSGNGYFGSGAGAGCVLFANGNSTTTSVCGPATGANIQFNWPTTLGANAYVFTTDGAGNMLLANISGDASGGIHTFKVTGIQGNAVTNTAPSLGQSYWWNALGSPTPFWALTITPTITGQVNFWNASTNGWAIGNLPNLGGVLAAAQEPAHVGDYENVAGSLSGTVTKIQGIVVSSTAPTAGQMMRLIGGVWTPVSLSAPNYESWCNGAIGVALGTEYYLFPGSTVATGTPCTGTAAFGMPVSGPCTAFALIVQSSAAGKDSTSGVVTVYHNGSPGALTCTLGTATFCSDSSDTISFSSGDTFYVGVESSTVNTLDTTANLRVAFQCQ